MTASTPVWAPKVTLSPPVPAVTVFAPDPAVIVSAPLAPLSVKLPLLADVLIVNAPPAEPLKSMIPQEVEPVNVTDVAPVPVVALVKLTALLKLEV